MPRLWLLYCYATDAASNEDQNCPINVVQLTSRLTDQSQGPRLPVNEDQLAAYL